ncbi:FliH/SctL family protein [Roseibium aquae]|nr:FliH/SctL family protein [Roseibium aquae]
MGKMVSPSKFLFDVDFAAPPEPEELPSAEPEIPMIPVNEHNRLLQEAKAQAFEQGRMQALQEHQSHQDRLLTEEVGHLVGAVGRVLGELEEDQAALEKDAASLAFLVARRLCAHLIARQPLAEIVALVSGALGPLRRAPHLVIRIHERDVEALKKRLDPIVMEKGYDGRLVILGEPDIARGDCRIEWADGGIIRDRKALEREIDARIKAYLQARANERQAGKVAADPNTQRDE